MSILDNYYGEGKSIRDKIEELEQENRRLSEKNKIYSNALVQEKEKKKSLKEERDNFMLEYAKALEEKVVETNKLCTERNKLEQENKSLKRELDVVKGIKNSSVNVLINADSKIKELEQENKYRRNQIKELKKELKAKKELLRYYQKKSGTIVK